MIIIIMKITHMAAGMVCIARMKVDRLRPVKEKKIIELKSVKIAENKCRQPLYFRPARRNSMNQNDIPTSNTKKLEQIYVLQ